MSGAGKSTLGEALANEIGVRYIDGDSLHPKENIDKMSNGITLDDDDRGPWLRKIREEGVKACHNYEDKTSARESEQRGLVIACSALKRSYRRILRGEDVEETDQIYPKNSSSSFPTWFVFIDGTRDELFERMKKRQGHYMKAEMLESQLATLEQPEPATEQGVIVVDLMDPTSTQVEKTMATLQGSS